MKNDLYRKFIDALRPAGRNRRKTRTSYGKSYTAYLLQTGIDKIGKKIGEESAEVIIAAKNADPVAAEKGEKAENLRLEVCKESADLLYHLAVLWEDTGVTVNDVMTILEERSHVKGNKKQWGI